MTARFDLPDWPAGSPAAGLHYAKAWHFYVDAGGALVGAGGALLTVGATRAGHVYLGWQGMAEPLKLTSDAARAVFCALNQDTPDGWLEYLYVDTEGELVGRRGIDGRRLAVGATGDGPRYLIRAGLTVRLSEQTAREVATAIGAAAIAADELREAEGRIQWAHMAAAARWSRQSTA